MGNTCRKPTIVERPPIRNIGKYSVDVGPVNVDRTGRVTCHIFSEETGEIELQCTRRIVQGIGANFHIHGLEAGKTYRVSFNCPYSENCRGGDEVTFTTTTV
uniref:Uncharacterized protein n=1 Tax=Toxoplasma gondii (strain ATCC 50861 / VEG) TaxID=432359 RepID=A0A0F7V3L1_TOXGV|nr:TPA: hypothetical protein BN1205_031305 [Toxoplasma gondii VEG]